MKFNIGDRVRTVIFDDHPELVGIETSIINIVDEPDGCIYCLDIVVAGYASIQARGDHIILIYDGHEPCAFDESIWSPLKDKVCT